MLKTAYFWRCDKKYRIVQRVQAQMKALNWKCKINSAAAVVDKIVAFTIEEACYLNIAI